MPETLNSKLISPKSISSFQPELYGCAKIVQLFIPNGLLIPKDSAF
jgi:hypothetical protein